VSQWLRVTTAQDIAATSAGVGDTGNDLLAFVARDQGALVLGMMGLAARLSLAFRFGLLGFGVRVFG